MPDRRLVASAWSSSATSRLRLASPVSASWVAAWASASWAVTSAVVSHMVLMTEPSGSPSAPRTGRVRASTHIHVPSRRRIRPL